MKARGFSLLELALVLLVMGILLGGALKVQQRLHARQLALQNQQILADVRAALVGFLLQNARLPCSDTNGDGLEDNSDGKCESPQPMPNAANPVASQNLKRVVVGGTLPYRQLGVDGKDAYNQPLVYVVSVHFADNAALYADPSPLPMLGSFMGLPATGVCPPVRARAYNALLPSFSSCSQGGIRVLGKAGDVGSLIYDDLPFMVVSTGNNGLFNQSDNERENTDNDRTFVLADYQQDGAHFDDDLMWLSAPVLALYLQDAGLLP